MSDASPAKHWPADGLEHLDRCPVCASGERVLLHAGLEDRIFGTAPGSWQLWRCGSCRCAYLDPRPTRQSIGAAYGRYFPRLVGEPPGAGRGLDGIRERLRNGYLNGRHGTALRPASRVGRALMPLFPQRRWSAALLVRGLSKTRGRARLLDVGFGDASFLRFMRAAGWDVTGLELDDVAVSAARGNGIDARLGTIEEAPFDPESFDAVTLSHVVEHLHDPVRSLETCRRLLRANGVLWLATPNVDSPGSRRFGPNWFGLDPPRHLVLFNVHGLDYALERAGFVELRHPRTYRAELVIAGSEALATGGDAASSLTPVSPKLRRLARRLDLAAAVHPKFGEELLAVAHKRA